MNYLRFYKILTKNIQIFRQKLKIVFIFKSMGKWKFEKKKATCPPWAHQEKKKKLHYLEKDYNKAKQSIY